MCVCEERRRSLVWILFEWAACHFRSNHDVDVVDRRWREQSRSWSYFWKHMLCLSSLWSFRKKKIVTFQKHILHLKTLINSSTSLLFVSSLSWPPESCVDRKPNFISLKVRQWRTGPRVTVHLGYGPLGLFLPQGEEGACTGNDATHAHLFNSSGQWWHRRSWYKRKHSPKETFSRFQSALIVRWERFFFLLFVFFHNNK